MNKKYLLVSLAFVALLGSLFTACAVNNFFSDIVNIQAGALTSTIFVSLPTICVAFSFVFATLYLIRIYKYKDSFKTLFKRFLIIVIALNSLGFISVILSGIITYGTLVSDHPFRGFQIMFMLISLLLIIGGVFGLIKLRGAEEDKDPLKIKVSYVFKTIGWVFFLLLAYDRFGTLLVSPTFIYYRTFYMTFPFYLFLLVPIFLGIVEVLYIFDVLDVKKIRLLAIIGGAVTICLSAYIVLMGLNDTGFISSVSQCMPLERIISKPVEIILHILAYLVLTIIIIIQARKPKEN